MEDRFAVDHTNISKEQDFNSHKMCCAQENIKKHLTKFLGGENLEVCGGKILVNRLGFFVRIVGNTLWTYCGYFYFSKNVPSVEAAILKKIKQSSTDD
jgi:hypothetical protein